MRQILTILLFGFAMTVFGAAEPKNIQVLNLSVGWNLVMLEGTPLRMQEFLELRPMVYDLSNQSYVMTAETMVLQRGTAVWIYSASLRDETIPLVAASITVPEPAPAPGKWSLVGVTSATPPWLKQITRPFFRWEAEKGFVPAETTEAKRGYWVKAK